MKTMFLFFSLMATDLSTPYNIANVKETFSFNKTSKNFQLKRHISENVLVQKASRITSTKEIDKQVKEMEQYLKLDDISEPKNLMLVLVPTTDSRQLKSTTGSSSQWSGQNECNALILRHQQALNQFSIGQLYIPSQIAKFMGPTRGPPGSCRPQMGPMNFAIRDH